MRDAKPSLPTDSGSSSGRELVSVLQQVLHATCALLEAKHPAELLGEDAPLARSLTQWRRALAALHGDEAGLLARGRLAEVENERDGLRVRQSELLEQVLGLTQRLQAAKREALGLRFEVDRARAEMRQLERELRELRPRGEPAPNPVVVEPPPIEAAEREQPADVAESALSAELEDARARTEQRGHDARAALDALFTPRPIVSSQPSPRAQRARQRKAPPVAKKKPSPPARKPAPRAAPAPRKPAKKKTPRRAR